MFNGGSRKRTATSVVVGATGVGATGVGGEAECGDLAEIPVPAEAGDSSGTPKYARHTLYDHRDASALTPGAVVCGLTSGPKLHPAFSLPFVSPPRYSGYLYGNFYNDDLITSAILIYIFNFNYNIKNFLKNAIYYYKIIHLY